MQILSVALTNFKTHKDQQFNFQPGTNAICGENGAGKTSILEAIAWVLFNYQGSYRKEDLIRNGASSAQARVAFISSKDSRTYEAQRSTTHGYSIYDPQLAAKLPITRTKEEVLPWLRQHMGVSPGTDLGQLFANTIGVPQGTFTTDFLLSTEKRKPIFDVILKVEEYRETYRKSNSLRKFAEAQADRLKDLIEQYEEGLQQWDELHNRHQQLQVEITQAEGNLERLEAQSKTLIEKRNKLLKQAEQVHQTQAQEQSLNSQAQAQEQAVTGTKSLLLQAQQSQQICQDNRVAYEQFLAAESQIKALDKQQQERQQVLQHHQQCQQALLRSEREISRIEVQIEQIKKARREVDTLAESVIAQRQLETEKEAIQEKVQSFASMRLQQQTIQQQVQQADRELAQIDAEVNRLTKLQSTIEKISTWEEEQTKLQEQLSRLSAARQFEQELAEISKAGQIRQDRYREQVVSALKRLESWNEKSEKLKKSDAELIKTALFEGGMLSKAMLDKINEILSDLGKQTDLDKLNRQRDNLFSQLQQAYAYRAEFASMEKKRKEAQDLRQSKDRSVQQLDQIEAQLAQAQETAKQLQRIEMKLKQLDNPRAKQQILLQTLQQEENTQVQHKTIEATRISRGKQLESIARQLQAFEQLDTQTQTQRQLQEANKQGYENYLGHQKIALKAEKLAVEHEDAIAKLKDIQAQQTLVSQQLNLLTANFDEKAFSIVDKQLTDTNSQADRLRGSLPQLKQRFSDATEQIERLKTISKKRDQASTELKQRERVKRFVNYARKVYKAAGPRITERYVQNVSREADRLFRELLGRPNVALTWSADYEITVQEGAHTRRFINLSGGEQMCAALAVRLALLKVLADIDVAFFDEPTTNMDKPRRRGLAEAISRIKSFQQLFVISHDDTFEQVTENVITVTRQN